MLSRLMILYAIGIFGFVMRNCACCDANHQRNKDIRRTCVKISFQSSSLKNLPPDGSYTFTRVVVGVSTSTM